MKIAGINTGFRGSTGRIMLDVANLMIKNGNEAYTFSGTKKENPPINHIYFSKPLENIIHRVASVFWGISGRGSRNGTKKLIKKLEQIKPDVLHLHNLHGWYINLPMLFEYIRKNDIRTVWTLHDCWAFTAQCSHFTIEKCDKWKTGCYSCPRYRIYPYTFVDKTPKMYELKKEWFTGVKNMTIVTPSQWLADLVKQSFLKEYPVKVINNGIDLNIFKPTESDFRKKHNLEDKKIVLGVAFGWGVRKGLDVFIELSKRLPDNYKIVLVGTDESIDKQLPSNILSIHRTQNQKELAEIYSAADVFVNPTREENYPTVNMESIACGTPVITFRTGGSPEIIDENTGIAVDVDDIDSLYHEIIQISKENIRFKKFCLEKSCNFDMNVKYEEYAKLFKEINSKRTKV